MSAGNDRPTSVTEGSRTPWQLEHFRYTLKKRQKLAVILELMGPVDGLNCLLVTCGDNNGAMNWHLREHGGKWRWADAEEESVRQIADLTGDPVERFDKNNPQLAFGGDTFDLIIAIDVHEHLEAPVAINEELFRVLRSGGRVIVTTPGGDTKKLANRCKGWLGMSADQYGHVVDGYSYQQLEAQLGAAGFTAVSHSSYSRFFTEMIELGINIAYVKLLANQGGASVEDGQIAPQSEEQLQSVGKSMRLYGLVYPGLRLVSSLDKAIQFTEGYAPIVVATKES